MKHFFIILLAAAAVLAPANLWAQGQNIIEQRFTEFSNVLTNKTSKHIHATVVMNERQSDTWSKQKQSEAYIYNFRFKVKQGSLLYASFRTLIDAISKAPDAYSLSIKQGTNTHIMVIGKNYNAKNPVEYQDAIILGKHYRNFATSAFIDPRQHGFRTAYAIEWTEVNKKTIIGRYVKTYARMPDMPQQWVGSAPTRIVDNKSDVDLDHEFEQFMWYTCETLQKKTRDYESKITTFCYNYKSQLKKSQVTACITQLTLLTNAAGLPSQSREIYRGALTFMQGPENIEPAKRP